MTRSSHSVRRLVAAAAVLTSALVFAVSAALAYDQRLDDADAAVEKAAVLLQEARLNPGVMPTPQAQKQYDRALARAVGHASKARDEIAAAKAIAGG